MNKTKQFTAILAYSLFAIPLTIAQPPQASRQEYINQYKDLAISEMKRSGIPASITLSQGILESGVGRSRLATEGNNHFGIKCADTWRGATIYVVDDDYDSQGNLKQSCFRKYKTPQESYFDHTEFLMTRDRYRFLFSYPVSDYENWAKGLKSAGYATAPNYADNLIRIIRENELYKYDVSEPLLADSSEEEEEEEIVSGKPRPKRPRSEYEGDSYEKNKLKKGIFYNNGLKTIIWQPGESLMEIAQKYDIRYAKLLKYNDLEEGQTTTNYQYLYLQNKKNKFRGRKELHTVKEKETMYAISQLYGIKFDKLLKHNKISRGDEVVPGTQIHLRGCAEKTPVLASSQKQTQEKPSGGIVQNFTTRFHQLVEIIRGYEPAAKPVAPASPPPSPTKPNPSPVVVQPAPTVITTPTITTETITNNPKISTPAPVPSVPKPGTVRPTTPSPKPTVPASTSLNHTVKAGDTLYNIARRYGTTADILKRLNQLTDDNIRLGQVLRVR